MTVVVREFPMGIPHRKGKVMKEKDEENMTNFVIGFYIAVWGFIGIMAILVVI